MVEVKLELAKEEAADAERGVQQTYNISASKFLLTGFDIEEQQYVFLISTRGLSTHRAAL